MAAVMWHPETGGMFEAPTEDAVAHYRQSGWLLLSERAEHEARLAERAAAEAGAAKAKTSKTDGGGK